MSTELQEDKLKYLIDYSRFILCDECCNDNQNCLMLDYNSSINIYELLNSLIKNFSEEELMMFSKYILSCNKEYSFYIDSVIDRSYEIRKIYGKYTSKLDVSKHLFSYYYMFFYNFFLGENPTDEWILYVKQLFEYDNIYKCIAKIGIDVNILTRIYNESIITFDIDKSELTFGFNDPYAQYVNVLTNLKWKIE